MGKSLTKSSSTSGSLHCRPLRLHYFMFLSNNLLIGSNLLIDACSYRWEQISSVLFLNKYLLSMPHEYYCSGCNRNCSCCLMDVLCTEYCNDSVSSNCKKSVAIIAKTFHNQVILYFHCS